MTPDERLYANLEDSRSGEGFRSAPYLDSRGCTTVLFGRNLIANPFTVDEGRVIMRQFDVPRVRRGLAQALPWVARLDDVRRIAIEELAYSMGIRGLLSFVKMLAAAEAEDWLTAHTELLNSSWARQVQLARRDRLAAMLLTGEELCRD